MAWNLNVSNLLNWFVYNVTIFCLGWMGRWLGMNLKSWTNDEKHSEQTAEVTRKGKEKWWNPTQNGWNIQVKYGIKQFAQMYGIHLPMKFIIDFFLGPRDPGSSSENGNGT